MIWPIFAGITWLAAGLTGKATVLASATTRPVMDISRLVTEDIVHLLYGNTRIRINDLEKLLLE
jgi:hypothetical protein